MSLDRTNCVIRVYVSIYKLYVFIPAYNAHRVLFRQNDVIVKILLADKKPNPTRSADDRRAGLRRSSRFTRTSGRPAPLGMVFLLDRRPSSARLAFVYEYLGITPIMSYTHNDVINLWLLSLSLLLFLLFTRHTCTCRYRRRRRFRRPRHFPVVATRTRCNIHADLSCRVPSPRYDSCDDRYDRSGGVWSTYASDNIEYAAPPPPPGQCANALGRYRVKPNAYHPSTPTPSRKTGLREYAPVCALKPRPFRVV